MPKEILCISHSSQDADLHLALHWGRHGDADPTPILTTWRRDYLPDGTPSEWVPEGTSWALDEATLDYLIRVARRARSMAYPVGPPLPPPDTVTDGTAGSVG